MFLNKYPIFERGRILKLEMIENLRDFPRDFFSVLTQKNSNGIMEGCEISASENYLVISKGILCFQHILYILKENVKIPYESTDELVLLKIKFLGEGRSKDFISYTTQIFLDKDTNIKNDELELCRFKLKAGAILRGDYVDFDDFETEYDTICRINVAYSAEEKSTLSPDILKCFATEAFSYTLENPVDIGFCMTCLTDSTKIGKDMILIYIRNRYQQIEDTCSNKEIYQSLKNILREIRHGKKGSRNHLLSERRILLD